VSIYEVLVFAALAGVGGFAYYLYRSDTRARPPGADAGGTEAATGQLMFKRVPQDRVSDSKNPSP
jgi:hypothetical protein